MLQLPPPLVLLEEPEEGEEEADAEVLLAVPDDVAEAVEVVLPPAAAWRACS